MLLVIDKQGDKMRKAHIRKQQIVDAIAKFQCLIDPGEHGRHIAAVPHGPWFEMLLDDRHHVEVGEQAASEMHPVNAPGMLPGAAIRMLYMLRKDKKFIRSDFIPLVPYLIPAMA